MNKCDDPRFARLTEVTERMRQQVFEAGSTARIHEEDILEAARLVRALATDNKEKKCIPTNASASSAAEALQYVLDWPLPNGTVETWALPPWLAKIAREALE